MASGTNAYPSHAGFNQSGGAYFMTLVAFETAQVSGTAPLIGSYVNALVNASSNSGGAFINATLSTVTMSNVLGATSAGMASTMGPVIGLTAANKLLKDMGRTVVSAGRTFRKFAPVALSASGVSTFGVVGAAGSGANAGYGSFYLEVGREGVGATPAPIVRYF